MVALGIEDVAAQQWMDAAAGSLAAGLLGSGGVRRGMTPAGGAREGEYLQMMRNIDVAKILEHLGELLEIDGEVGFKVRAYQRAAEAVNSLHEPVATLHADGRLLEVPGIGKAICEKIGEILSTGTCQLYERMKSKIPQGVVDMLQIPGLGPKKAGTLFHQLGIKSLDELEHAATSGKLSGLPGMGKKTEDNILEGIARLRQRPDRLPIGKVRPYAENMAAQLRQVPGAERVEVAGSLRRWRETVKDLDLVASSSEPLRLMDAFVCLPQVDKVLLRGETKTTVLTGLGIQADLRVVLPGHFASLLSHFTGSAGHNVRLRSIANSRGLRINEYGVYRESDGEAVPIGDDEHGLYDLLGLQYVAPELREDTGEVESASTGRLHRPVEQSDFRCDLHCHTHWSDGHNTIAEMAAAARSLGYTHLGITDHSGSLPVAHGLTVDRIREQIREIRQWNDANADDNFRLLAGTECDILPDGRLDWPDEVIGELDFLVASVHSRFKMDETEMTARIVSAVETGKVSILGHPTGRLLGSRDPYAVDLSKVFAAALKTGTCVEIDGHPERLDLNDTNARLARQMGLRIAVDSDAHDTEGLPLIEYGVHAARRAWLSAADVINTFPLDKLLRVFKREE